MSTETLPAPPLTDPPQHQIPGHLVKDFAIITLLIDEVEKSGEFYLKVALWKVLLRLPQHCDDIIPPDHADGKEAMKQMLISTIYYSEQIIRSSSKEGGLDLKKHGVTEQVVRENINWMRQKLAVLETKITEPRKAYILHLFSGES